MMKHSLFGLLVALATTTLAGCQLYFGEDDDDDRWDYCGEEGYYRCEGNDCYWQGSTCPSGVGNTPPGFECNSSEDCAAGCYCGNGICEEAGFCTTDEDCGNGYYCNTPRASCEPINPGTDTSCGADNDCPSGQYCNSETLKCEATCFCTNDMEAVAQGYAYCDSSRSTCLPGIDPAGDCTSEVTCNQYPPKCAEGHVPLILDGCYTGVCEPIYQCSYYPACSSLQHESDCFAADGCDVTYTGINCRNENTNQPCTAGSTNCVCDDYKFASCNATP